MKIGRTDEAKPILIECQEHFLECENLSGLSYTHLSFGEFHLLEGALAEALTHLIDCYLIRDSINHYSRNDEILDFLGETLLKIGRDADSLLAFALAENLRIANSFSLETKNRVKIDGFIQCCKDNLKDESTIEIWSQGINLGLKEIPGVLQRFKTITL